MREYSAAVGGGFDAVMSSDEKLKTKFLNSSSYYIAQSDSMPTISDSKTYYIIVDTSPIGQVIDCAVMAPALDGVIMVIDTTHNSFKLQRRIKQQLEKSGAKILGAVLNRVNFADKHSYNKKDYGYGHSYGYNEESVR